MDSGIYILEWKERGYFYYGQSYQLSKREGEHFRAFRRGNHFNKRLQRTYNKYGYPKYIIVEYCEVDKLDEREQVYISANFHKKECCNLSPTASGQRGIKRSLKTREKIRQAKIGTTQSDEQKENSRQLMLARYATGWSPPRNKGKKNGFYKKKHDLITKILMSQMKQGVYDGGKNPRAKLVLNTETGIFYETMREATKSQTKYKEGTIMGKLSKRKNNNTNFILV